MAPPLLKLSGVGGGTTVTVVTVTVLLRTCSLLMVKQQKDLLPRSGVGWGVQKGGGTAVTEVGAA